MNSVKGKIDQLLETLISRIGQEAKKNSVKMLSRMSYRKFRSLSFHHLRQYIFPFSFIPSQGHGVPLPVNYVVSAMHGSQHNQEDPEYDFYMAHQERKPMINAARPPVDKSDEKYRDLEERLKAIEGYNPGLDVVDLEIMTFLLCKKV